MGQTPSPASQSFIHFCNQPSQIQSSGRLRCPRLQLRGSAGFAPASLSLSSERNARTQFESRIECTFFRCCRQFSSNKIALIREYDYNDYYD